jgi:hypothetical protein
VQGIRPDGSGAVDDEALDVGGRERLELHHVCGFPLGPSLDEVGTGKAQREDPLGRLPREVLDEIEERRLSPVEVLEHHDEGATAGKGLEQATDRGEQDRGGSGSARSPIAVAISGATSCPSWSSASNR